MHWSHSRLASPCTQLLQIRCRLAVRTSMCFSGLNVMLDQQGAPLFLQLPFLPIFGLKPGSCRHDTMTSARNLACIFMRTRRERCDCTGSSDKASRSDGVDRHRGACTGVRRATGALKCTQSNATYVAPAQDAVVGLHLVLERRLRLAGHRGRTPFQVLHSVHSKDVLAALLVCIVICHKAAGKVCGTARQRISSNNISGPGKVY